MQGECRTRETEVYTLLVALGRSIAAVGPHVTAGVAQEPLLQAAGIVGRQRRDFGTVTSGTDELHSL